MYQLRTLSTTLTLVPVLPVLITYPGTSGSVKDEAQVEAQVAGHFLKGFDFILKLVQELKMETSFLFWTHFFWPIGGLVKMVLTYKEDRIVYSLIKAILSLVIWRNSVKSSNFSLLHLFFYLIEVIIHNWMLLLLSIQAVRILLKVVLIALIFEIQVVLPEVVQLYWV